MLQEAYNVMEIEEASKRLGMPEEIVIKIAKKFLMGDTLAALKLALTENNQEGCKRHLHTVKGAAANVGLTGLSQFAAIHEENIKKNVPFTKAHLAILEGLWEEVIATI